SDRAQRPAGRRERRGDSAGDGTGQSVDLSGSPDRREPGDRSAHGGPAEGSGRAGTRRSTGGAVVPLARGSAGEGCDARVESRVPLPARTPGVRMPWEASRSDVDAQAGRRPARGGGGESTRAHRAAARLEEGVSRRGRRGRKSLWGRGVAAALGWLVLLLGSLSLVTWRQARGVELERLVREAEAERAMAESDGLAARRRVEERRGRARIVRGARDRLGRPAPGDAEI